MGRRRPPPDESDFASIRYKVYFTLTSTGFAEAGRVLVYDGPVDVPDDAAYEPLEREVKVGTDPGSVLSLSSQDGCRVDSYRLEKGHLRSNEPRVGTGLWCSNLHRTPGIQGR